LQRTWYLIHADCVYITLRWAEIFFSCTRSVFFARVNIKFSRTNATGWNLFQLQHFSRVPLFGMRRARDPRRGTARNGEERRGTRASPTRAATHALARPRGAHGRVKEAKINCNLIRGSKPGPITIRCASSASTGREEWRRAWGTTRRRDVYLPPSRPCGKCRW